MKNTEFEEAMDYACKKVQEYTDRIQDVFNPIPGEDMPFLYRGLQAFIEAVEANMDTEQKVVADSLKYLLSTERVVTVTPRGTYEKLKKSDGGNK